MNDKDKYPKGKDTDVRTTSTGATTEADRVQLAQAIDAQRAGIVLTGRVVNGRVELDQATLNNISQRFAASPDISFVAVNAPFDPQTAELTA